MKFLAQQTNSRQTMIIKTFTFCLAACGSLLFASDQDPMIEDQFTSLFNIPYADFHKGADQIIWMGRMFNRDGLVPATAGNISVRLTSDYIAITASGMHKGELTEKDILLINLQGKVLYGSRKPSAETLLHTSVYEIYDDVGAVVHNHTLNGIVLSRLLASEREIITKGYEIHKIFPGVTTHDSEYSIPIFENSQDYPALSKEISDYLKKHPKVCGYILRGHGLYTWGRDMQEARNRAEAFENLFASELLFRSIQKS